MKVEVDGGHKVVRQAEDMPTSQFGEAPVIAIGAPSSSDAGERHAFDGKAGDPLHCLNTCPRRFRVRVVEWQIGSKGW